MARSESDPGAVLSVDRARASGGILLFVVAASILKREVSEAVEELEKVSETGLKLGINGALSAEFLFDSGFSSRKLEIRALPQDL